MKKISKNLILKFFFIIYLFFGLFIYKDYGIGIEEHFQRQNGFYWLNFLLNFTNFVELKNIANLKLENILTTDPNLPKISFFNFYGIIFDVPTAFLETLLNLKSSKLYFELRHFLNFFVFFISSIFFYQILKKRFNYLLISLTGLSMYVLTPRIFGDSFHNNKDVLFLSFITIAISFLFKYFEKSKKKHLILFVVFSAVASSTRIMGIYLPILFIFFIFIELINKKIDLKFFVKLILQIILLFLIFLYLHYPYIWKLNIFNFVEWFQAFFYSMNIKLLFNGKYYFMDYLPRSYLPVWILISTPLIISILFILGSFLSFRRFFKRILKIDYYKSSGCDLWVSVREKKDLFILMSFFSFFIYGIFLNVAMLSGWRHFYFLHIFIIYISTYYFYYLIIFLKKKINLKIIYFTVFLLITFLINENIKFHPFQSLYFNNLMSKNYIEKFQKDSPSLSRTQALRDIMMDKNNKEKIYVANASWIPFHNGKDLLDDKLKNKLVFVGQDFEKADYIYDNFIYKSDISVNKRRIVPNDFTIFKKLVIDRVHIYSIYKKN